MQKYIYILVGAIWIISKIVEATQTKNKNAKPITNPVASPKKIEEFLPSQKRKPLQPKAPVRKSDPKPFTIHNDSQELMIDESLTDTETIYKQPQKHETAAQSYYKELANKKTIFLEEETLESIEFDARKAIIFSEILGKPKYSEWCMLR